jgi:hypothetical protein
MTVSLRVCRYLLGLSIGITANTNGMADILQKIPMHSPYQAEYRVYWHGIYAANAYQSIEKIAKNRYIASMHVKPRLPFIPFEYDENSLFLDNNNGIKPLIFSFKSQEKNKHLDGWVTFNWKTGARTRHSASQKDSPPIILLPTSQDKISLVFQLSRYLENKPSFAVGEQWSHQVIEAKKEKTYLFEYLQEEPLETPLGLLQTIKIKQQAQQSLRHSYLWFAKDKDFALVKIAQFKDNQLIGYTVLNKIYP